MFGRSLIPNEAFSDQIYRQYIVTASSQELPVTLYFVKEQLRLPQCDTSQDAYLTVLIRSAAEYAEKFMGRTLITKSFQTFRDFFPECIVLRKSPLQQVDSIQYFLNGVLTLLDSSTYFNTVSNDYSHIFSNPDTNFPLADCRPQSVQVDFTAGYGDSSVDIPDDIQLAIAEHVTNMYSNRGDCSCSIESCLPCQSMATYNQYRVMDISPWEVC